MVGASPRNGLLVAGFIVGGIGAVFVMAGALIRTYSPGAIMARHDRMQALASPGAAALADTPLHQEVLVDGRIARDQPVLFRDFVAFIKEEEERDRRDDDRTEWKVRDRQAPPLRIVLTGDDAVRVVNYGYGLWGATTTWYDRSKILETRYTGLVAGEAVVVHGRTAPGGLEAIEVASGTRATYLAGIAASVGVAWWLGTGFAIGGGVMLLIAATLFVMAVKTHGGSLPRRGRNRTAT
jgi:hypothetical protein